MPVEPTNKRAIAFVYGPDFGSPFTIKNSLDNHQSGSIIGAMTQSVEQVVKDFRRIAQKLRKEHRDPAKARAFLLRAGIAEKHKSSPGGIQLAKRFR
jgi:hypothetical protein